MSSTFIHASSETDASWKHEAEYFKSVRMRCEVGRNETIHLWILPSGEVLRPTNENAVNHVSLKDDGAILEIDRVDDEQFGMYLCIVGVGDSIKVIKHGLNIDGPYYGDEYGKRVRHSAMIGGICAAGTLLIIVGLCLINAYCCKRSKETGETPGNSDIESGDVNKGRNKSAKTDIKVDNQSLVSTAEMKADEPENLEKIYDQADGILAPLQKGAERHEGYENAKVGVSWMDSGEYHTISDLGYENTELSKVNQCTGSLNSAEGLGDRETINCNETVENGDIIHNGGPQDAKKNNKSHKYENRMDSQINGLTTANRSASFERNVSEETEPFSSLRDDAYIYAVPNKPKRRTTEKETVVIIEGEVIIEENGAKIVVTSSPSTPGTMSETENVVNKLSDKFLENHQTEKSDIPYSKKSSENHNTNENMKTDYTAGFSVYDDAADKYETTDVNEDTVTGVSNNKDCEENSEKETFVDEQLVHM